MTTTSSKQQANELYLVEYYTRQGMIHFVWIERCKDQADAREKAQSAPFFKEIITVSEEYKIHPLVCDGRHIHFLP